MKGKKRIWKRADCRIRLFCRRLTERQRICLLALLFLLLLAGCIHAIGSPLRRSERGGGSPVGDRTHPGTGTDTRKREMNIQPNFMRTYIGKIIERTRERLRIPIKGERKPLTEEEKRKRARLVVYPLFALLFAGCIWLIYSPSRKEREETVQGFNTDIPSPENRKMRKSKVDAYEEEELMRKEKQRRGTFQEMASLFDRGKRDTVRLPETPGRTGKPAGRHGRAAECATLLGGCLPPHQPDTGQPLRFRCIRPGEGGTEKAYRGTGEAPVHTGAGGREHGGGKDGADGKVV